MVASSLYIGTLPLVLEDPQEQENGNGALDTVNFRILASSGNWQSEMADLGFERDSDLPAEMGYHNMWCHKIIPTERTGSTVTVEVSAVGIITPGEKRRTTYSGQEKRISVGPQDEQPGPLRNPDGSLVYEELNGFFIDPNTGLAIPRERYPNVTVGGSTSGNVPALSIGFGVFSVSSTYFSGSRPTGVVGQEGTPPDSLAPGESAAITGEFLQLRENCPHGWILTSSTTEELFNNSTSGRALYQITEVFTFYPHFEPA